MMNFILGHYCRFIRITSLFSPLSLLALRLWMAKVFLVSGWLKLNDFQNAVFLFEYEYGLPLIPPHIAAFAGTAAEIILPLMLILGLGTRFAALGLLGVSLVIELLVYPGTTDHYYWMLLLGALITQGGGKLSADAVIEAKYSHKK